MVRPLYRTGAAVALTSALVLSTAATGVAATPSVPLATGAEDGRYIVVLEGDALATYTGGVAGIEATAPEEGERLDANAPNSRAYLAHLRNEQRKLAREEGIEFDNQYGVSLNGFSAELTAEQVTQLRASKEVRGVFPDELRQPTAQSSTDFLGLGDDQSGSGGVWDAVGGLDGAGEGVVIGVVDTGIDPDHASFAGNKLKKANNTPAGEPYTEGSTVVFDKADGAQFRSDMISAEEWNKHDYSTKLIGAHYFADGFSTTTDDMSQNFLSPRDNDGHGSHTAGTAAGEFGVAATVEGVDFGTISGVAPAAKVAAYKACWDGPDPTVTTDDGCMSSDLLAAIDQAVADGVDVINYSIGGGSASSVLQPEDISFYNAAAAGVFVAVSAGNSGPDHGTSDHASPWYTSVAASTIPTWEGTVELADGTLAPGVTVSVPDGETVDAELVYAGDIPAAGASAADAALCVIGSVDDAAAAGKILVCDRGEIARVDKSAEAAESGAVGAILVNVLEDDSLDNDFHSVPTVHVQGTYRDAIVAAASAGESAVLHSDNISGVTTPVPQVAGFSSRGPMNVETTDIIKPDVAAPGVAILAATNSEVKQDDTFGVLSGTSMASPHVAGLAALYLAEHPDWQPADVKSALMTTAYDTLAADGSALGDPFAQGAGHVDPTAMLDPSLLYRNDTDDWSAYLQGLGLVDFGLPADAEIDPSDLNLASIGIGSLSAPQTVTRTITATEAGTFTASASVPGVDVTIEPSQVTLAAGESAEIAITFANVSAPVEQWATGHLTWTGGANDVRSPIAIHPVTADVPAEAAGTGVDGSVEIAIEPGITGDLDLRVAGLAAEQTVASGTEASDEFTYTEVTIEEGTDLARFDLLSSDDAGSDLDLTVYRVAGPGDWSYYEYWQSATVSADEHVVLTDPVPGTYLIESSIYSFTDPFTWDQNVTLVNGEGEGGFAAAPNPLPVEQGVPASFELSWAGLAPDATYYGVVGYGDSALTTVVRVDTAE